MGRGFRLNLSLPSYKERWDSPLLWEWTAGIQALSRLSFHRNQCEQSFNRCSIQRWRGWDEYLWLTLGLHFRQTDASATSSSPNHETSSLNSCTKVSSNIQVIFKVPCFAGVFGSHLSWLSRFSYTLRCSASDILTNLRVIRWPFSCLNKMKWWGGRMWESTCF